MEQSETLTTSDGTRLRAWFCAAPDPRAVVGLVHGLGEHSGRYTEWAEALVAEGIAVAGFDQRGHGRSPGTRGHARYELLLDDLHSLTHWLRERGPGLPCVLYGHSLGGQLVLSYAIRRRPRLAGVIASSPLLLPARRVPAWKRSLGRLLAGLVPTFGFDTLIQPEMLTRQARVQAAYLADPLVHHRVSARLGTSMLDAGRWLLEHAGQLSLPTLLLHGDADGITSSAASRQFARGAGDWCQLRIWPGLLHELHHEPEWPAILRQVVHWLDHVPLASGGGGRGGGGSAGSS